MRIGLGLAALGRPGYINLQRDADLSSRTVDGMQRQANVVMDELFRQCRVLNDGRDSDNRRGGGGGDGDDEKYIPWLDCARSYGLSEKFVGDYLRANDVRPDEVYVSSKWGYTYVADWNVELGEGEPHEIKDHSLKNFLKQVEETKANVGPYLNLYQVHSATFDSGILTNTEVHEAMHRCRVENGWNIGLSVSGPNQDELIREALKIHVSVAEDEGGGGKRRLFDSVQCTYNVLEQRPGPALLEATEAGMDVIVKEGLANGRALRHPALLEEASRAMIGNGGLCSTPDRLALGAVLAQPFRPRVLSGAVTAEQLRSNLGALYPVVAMEGGDESVALQGAEEMLTTTEEGKEMLWRLMEGCRMESEEYWTDRSELKWN
eukprot:CAMPEP_0172529130 /NCGR_PEP_ID=MMETSP1067-20121228/3293_1 /TAXON_ID=265564 ORGANISM="Thalassiosira punctigera, Strain Tpunct2005C2" /NCGR_SAMPLE_ID=MMETSP1067 /ASSEMBLY_ACC=CAM_ASM_000444 /LENGTH=376 /DNA_ID=CAMNT_0013313131 /DNA_START=10 /DNA_END=1140 /DNA_ORIENTATION=-